jgi:hypothetical protein
VTKRDVTAPSLVYVVMTWDSGPYGVYYEADKPGAVPADWYGKETVAVPREVWERYQAAKDEFHAAEAALSDAGESVNG